MKIGHHRKHQEGDILRLSRAGKKLKAGGKQGGNKKPQTFRLCIFCHKEFGPLGTLKRKLCSRKCMYAWRSTQQNPKKGRHYPHLQRAATRQCRVCGQDFRAVNDHLHRKQLYCSKACWNIRGNYHDVPCKKCGTIFYQRGERMIYCSFACYVADPENMRRKRRNPDIDPKFQQSHEYKELHHWVKNKLGQPLTCEGCLKTVLPIQKQSMHWANVDHEYRRRLDEWLRLCASCHHKYDKGTQSPEWVKAMLARARARWATIKSS